MSPILRKYGASATINFDLVNPDGVDFSAAATFAPGDLKIMKDEGAEVNTTNLPVDEGQGYSLLLTATEMQAARIAIYIVDQDATKVWLDRAIHIDTYGHASGQHAFDLDTASQIIASVTGSVGSVAGNVTGSVGSVAGNVDGNVTGSIGSLAAAAKADVNAEVDAALDTAVPGTPTANSINERVKTIDDNYTAARAGNLDNLDAAMTSRLAPTVAGRTLDVTATGEAGIDLANTAGSLAKGTEITGFNDLSAAQVNTEVDTAIADANLNDLVQITGSVSDTTPAAGNFDGDAGLSATDNFYVGQVLIFTAGAMAGLGRRISGYTGATKNIVLENAFPAAPANGDAFSIVAIEVQSAAGGGATDWSAAEKENIRDALGVTGVKTAATGGQLQAVKTQTDGLNFIGTDVKATLDSEQVNLVADQSAATIGTVNRSADTVHRGTAVGGGTSSISLDAGASVTDATYNGCRIAILSGTGAGQSRLIITYNGTTKVASVQPVWTTQPSTDSVFTILAGGRIPGIEGTKNQLDDLADGDATLANQTNIEADTQDIQSRLPTALVAGRMKSDTEAISASVAAADQLELSVLTIATGSAIAGTLSTTQMTTDLTEATDDHYKGRTLIWTSGALNKQATDITAFSGANKMLTFTAVTDVPLAGDTFVIV